MNTVFKRLEIVANTSCGTNNDSGPVRQEDAMDAFDVVLVKEYAGQYRLTDRLHERVQAMLEPLGHFCV